MFGPVAAVDAETSLPILMPALTRMSIAEPMVLPVSNYEGLREALNSPGWDAVKSIFLEATPIERWCVDYVLRTIKGDKGVTVKSVEGYGYGRGFQFVYDAFSLLISDLDKHAQAGRNVLLIAHDCVMNVPNPGGEDWIRYEPRLQTTKTGSASIRAHVKEWVDHCLFYSYDITIDEDGKAKGGGTRAIYTKERPHFMAKSRTTDETIVVNTSGSNVWDRIII